MKRNVFILIFLVFTLVQVMAQEITPDKLFYQAVYAEQVDGDLGKAKALYEQILKSKPDDRTLTAKTLYRLGLIGEKEGTQKALGYYTKVIEQYPEQKDIIEMVQTRVDKLDNAKTFIDPRDGHKYKWVKIGNQIWMAENLAYMPHVNPPKKQENGIWVYGYDGQDIAAAKATENYQKYGCLYSWTTAMAIDEKYLTQAWKGDTINHQGICPSGWHLPTDTEWKELEMALGMPDSAANDEGFNRAGTFSYQKLLFEYPPVGRFLKSTASWLSDGNGDNTSGFSALPGGVIYPPGGPGSGFNSLGTYSSFWTSTEFILRNRRDSITGFCAWTRDLMGGKNKDDIYRLNWDEHSSGHSVRCVKDYKGEYPKTNITVRKAKEFIRPMDLSKAISATPKADLLWKKQNTERWVKTVPYKNQVICTAGKSIYAVEIETGKLLWQHEVPGNLDGDLLVAKNRILFSSLGILHCIDLDSWKEYWQFKAPEGGGEISWSENRVILMAEKFNINRTADIITSLYCIDFETGTTIWKKEINEYSSSRPLVAHNRVFVGTYNTTGERKKANLIAVDFLTGKELWRFPVIKTIFSSPVATDKYVIFTCTDQYIYALDLQTGANAWRFFSEYTIEASPCIEGNNVYFGDVGNRFSGIEGNSNFYSLNASTGKVNWQIKLDFNTLFKPPQYLDNKIIISGKILLAIDKDSGKERWHYDTGKGATHPFVSNGIIIINDTEGTLYALKPPKQ